jgi:co-chaperonin GroES (HSP10)
MKALFLLRPLVVIAACGSLLAYGQTPQPASTGTQATDPSITATRVIGEVKTIDAGAKLLTVKTDAGSVVTVTLSDATSYMRLAPGETTLAKATKITLADVGEGDRVLASGKVADDHKSVPSRTLVVMSKADIAKKQEKERLEWRQRGILGVVSALKPDTKEVTITRVGSQPVIIPVSDKLDLRRYAPDSIKFSDAKPSTFGELQLGDQVRALGDKNADGTHFAAEKVVTGSFQTVLGKVTAVDAATGEIKINNMQTKQPLTIVIKAESVLRKVPAEMGAAMMGGGRGPGAGGSGSPGGAQGAAGNKPAQGAGGAPTGGGAGGPAAGGMRAGGPNIQDMLDKLPTITPADVKVGDTIVVSSTKGADPTRLTAITLVSGADTLLAIFAPRPQPGAGQSAPNPAAGLTGISFGIGLP